MIWFDEMLKFDEVPAKDLQPMYLQSPALSWRDSSGSELSTPWQRSEWEWSKFSRQSKNKKPHQEQRRKTSQEQVDDP